MQKIHNLTAEFPPTNQLTLFTYEQNGRTLAVIDKIDSDGRSQTVTHWNSKANVPIGGVHWQAINMDDAAQRKIGEVFFADDIDLSPCPFCGGKPTMAPTTHTSSVGVHLTSQIDKHTATLIRGCCDMVFNSKIVFDGGVAFAKKWNKPA